VKTLITVLLLIVFCGCASEKSLQTNDFLSQAFNHPGITAMPEAQSRYWLFGNFLVHFVTNVNEKNRNLPPVIYVHGLGGTLDGFADLIKLIHHSSSSRPFYAIDLPPFGKSAMKESELSIHSYSEMLQEFVAILGVPKVNLVCHSMGGQVCIDFALANPNQIQLLTLISPAGVYERSAFVNESVNHFAGINVGPIDYPHARSFGDLSWYDQEFARRMITNNPLVLVGIESYREDFHNRIQKLKPKTLIIWGREDKIFSYENGLYLKENVENSTLYVIDGADHTSFATHAGIISKLIQKYL
jgi:pimeloyl-ACP methyl ester carboxylesterase